MALTPFRRSQLLLEQVDSPMPSRTFGRENAPDLLYGTEALCIPLSMVLRFNMGQPAWSRVNSTTRPEMLTSYESLGNAAERLRLGCGLYDPNFKFPDLSGERSDMARSSELARHIAGTIGDFMDDFRDTVDMDDVTDLAVSALRTTVAWRSRQQYFRGQQAEYYTSQFERGLSRLEDAFAAVPTGPTSPAG